MPPEPDFEILALAGWVADRNERAMRGALAMGRRIARRTGAPLREMRVGVRCVCTRGGKPSLVPRAASQAYASDGAARSARS